ncbi:MAG: helix-turn-helix transcriptional regulator [Deinococcus sp.]|nr:helix-turn-helix transcriptional regulator [Deinococcus sp.]
MPHPRVVSPHLQRQLHRVWSNGAVDGRTVPFLNRACGPFLEDSPLSPDSPERPGTVLRAGLAPYTEGTSILATKLHRPLFRPDWVRRPRLVERLNEGGQCRLTLVAAPAGFGKTTLLSEWAAGLGRPLAWLSLDAAESDPARFVEALVAALQTVAGEIGADVARALQSSPPPPTDAVLAALLEQIAQLPHPVVLVLDDYHRVDAEQVDAALLFVLEHLPPTLHLVMATREDPQLPLARWRAQGQLTELRAADLRFTATEAAAFLNRVMGLGLSAADITTLEHRTEGWIAGLQLAALSMRGREDLPEFIQRFAGDHRYVVDYLAEEVLRRQPEPLRQFLLQTAVLERLTGPLCDAVTGQTTGNARLAALERSNAFVVALDDQRRWYRYHHLFGEVLLVHLKAEHPDQVAGLHLRASAWYEQQGLPADAVRHALAGHHLERAADLIELAVPALRRDRQEATVLGWLRLLPDEVVRRRPVLSVYYAGALLMGGEIQAAQARLHDAERWLHPAADPGARVVVDEQEFRGLAGSIAIYRAGIALSQGDLTGTVRFARQVLELAQEDDDLRRGSAAGFLAIVSWRTGDLEAAHRSYTGCMTWLQRAGYLPDAIGCAAALAQIRQMQGRLREAALTYGRGLTLAASSGPSPLRGAADMHVGLSEIHRESGDLSAAAQDLRNSAALGEFAGLPPHPARWRVALARLRETTGDLDGALELLAEAERVYISDLLPDFRPLSALRARVWVLQGRLEEALGWARDRQLSVDDELTSLREFEHITLARILLAQGTTDAAAQVLPEARALLARLLPEAQNGGRTGSVIEILMLQALAEHRQGGLPAALLLAGALERAEPEGYVRLFLDEGSPLRALLTAVSQQPQVSDSARRYARRLLTADHTQAPRPPQPRPSLETLSERELEVLRRLGSELDGPALARELRVSLNTLRTHTKNIYSKLGVNSRRSAVRRAEELGLL